jgi:hypothetical protein
VRLTVISDSCFSGTVTRTTVSEVLPGLLKTPDDRRVRFLKPALRGGTGWPVEDGPAVTFATVFYENVLQGNG